MFSRSQKVEKSVVVHVDSGAADLDKSLEKCRYMGYTRAREQRQPLSVNVTDKKFGEDRIVGGGRFDVGKVLWICEK